MSNLAVMSSTEIEAVFLSLPGVEQARYIEQVRKYAPAVARRLTSILIGDSEPLSTVVAERRDEDGIALAEEEIIDSFEYNEDGEPYAAHEVMARTWFQPEDTIEDVIDVNSFIDQLDD